MDAISTGVSIGWAMECFEGGILNKQDFPGTEPKFGNHEALIEVIHLIATRKGIGNLLAEGVKRASKKVGKGSQHFAMHAKGMELPGFEVRGLKATGFGFAISTRGGCHVRSGSYDLNLKKMVGRLDTGKRIGSLVKETEDFASLIDSLLICRFTRGLWKNFEARFYGLAELYSLVTGFEASSQELRKTGERITNLKKLFNLREGWKRKDDDLPPRIKDPLPLGPVKGSRITNKEIESFLNSYYKAREWEEKTGISTSKKLKELGLEKEAKKICRSKEM
jgi:aldehyde:ferredoxin oxidoreductase